MRDGIEFVPEDAQFGLMNWRLLSREINDNGEATNIVKALPVMGMGVYIRTFQRLGADWHVDEPMLLKNVLMVELMELQGTGLVDAEQRPMGMKFKCINRELMTMDEAKKRFAPHGPKSMPPGIDLYPGAILTQERRPMPQMANIVGRGKGPLAAVPSEPPPAPEAPSTP